MATGIDPYGTIPGLTPYNERNGTLKNKKAKTAKAKAKTPTRGYQPGLVNERMPDPGHGLIPGVDQSKARLPSLSGILGALGGMGGASFLSMLRPQPAAAKQAAAFGGNATPQGASPTWGRPQPAPPFGMPGFRLGTDTGEEVAPLPEDLPPNFLEYLARYSGQSQADTSAIDAAEADLRRRAGEGTTAIGNLYGSLASQLAGQQGSINENYARGQQQATANAEQTAAAIAAGGSAADAQREALMRNLGQGDQVNSAVNQEASQDQQRASANAARSGQILRDELISGNTTQLDLNNANQTAARQRGTEEQAAIQSQLLSRLSELAGQRSEAQQAASGQDFEMAKLLFDSDNSRYNSDREYSAGRDDEMWNRGLDQRNLEAKLAPAAAAPDKAVTSQIQSRLRATGVPSAQQQGIMDLLMSGDAVGLAGRSQITDDLLRSYGIDPKYRSLVGTQAFEFWNAFQS